MTQENKAGATLANDIWNVAEILWGDFQHKDFGKVILPFTLLRRLECVLEPTRDDVRDAYEQHKDSGIQMDRFLPQVAGHTFYNTSEYALETLGATKTRENLEDYIAKFSDNARIIFEQFDFTATIQKLDKAGLLYRICLEYANTDLHPDRVPDRVMSNVYEHLIRRFGASVNEGAEDFMTPRDVVRLATALVLHTDNDLFEQQPGIIRTVYDPTCGTGGFLSDAISYVGEMESKNKAPPKFVPFGQELEPETHAVCLTSMVIQGFDTKSIKLGSTLSDDQLSENRFHYCMANPPFGKKWEKDGAAVNREFTEKGFAGRFGPGLPRISDGSMLFLMHLVSKMERVEDGGGRVAIVLSGSPLFNGSAGSGESEIRRWLLEHDYVDAIVALPTEIFFRTGIGTYIWLLTNNKEAPRKGKVQLIDATQQFTPMKNEGNKRRKISDEQIDDIVKCYDAYEGCDTSKVMDSTDFGYRKIKVLRPLRMKLVISEDGLAALKQDKPWNKLTDEFQNRREVVLRSYMGETKDYHWSKEVSVEMTGVSAGFTKSLIKAFGVRDPELDPVLDSRGRVMTDSELTDYESVPLNDDIHDYFAREVLPHVSDAWIDESWKDERDGGVGKVGYEINFNRYFYEYVPPRPLEDIDADLKQVEDEIAELLAEVAG